MSDTPTDTQPDQGMLEREPWYAESDFRPGLMEPLATSLSAAATRSFVESNAANQVGRDVTGLSMSGLGGCARRAAYALARVPATDLELATQQEARAAMIGTWIHSGYLPHLSNLVKGSRMEMPVRLEVPLDPAVRELRPAPGTQWDEQLTLAGTTDLWVPAMGGGVLDLKTLGAYKLGDVQAKGAREEHRSQVRGYATACVQQGMPVRWVAWLYMDRSTGDVYLHIEEFDDAAVLATYDRVRYLAGLAGDPDYAPTRKVDGYTLRGPSPYSPCNSCPWLQQCWGPGTKPDDTSTLEVSDDEERAFFAQKVVELKEQVTDLNKEIQFYEERVGRPRASLYGDFSVTYGKAQERLDTTEARKLLEAHGIPVPMKATTPSRFIRRAQTKETNQ